MLFSTNQSAEFQVQSAWETCRIQREKAGNLLCTLAPHEWAFHVDPSSNSSRGKLSSHGKHAGTQIRANLAPCRAYLGSVTIETRTFKTAQRKQTLLSSAAAPSHSAIEQVYGAKKRRDTSATKASAVDTGLHAKDRWITLILIFHVRVNILGTRTQCSSRTPTPNSRCASSSAV